MIGGQILRLQTVTAPAGLEQDWAKWRITLWRGEELIWTEDFTGSYAQACDRQDNKREKLSKANN